MNEPKQLSILDALIVGCTLLLLVGGAITLFGSDSMAGSTQIALILSGFVGALVGMKNGISWEELEASIVETTSRTLGPILIFLAIGSLIGSFMLSGAVPTLLYLGLKLLSPTFFYPLCCLISALVAICIGSSWTTAATIGVGLMGVSIGFSLSPAVTAGAVISGAYFGDKMSPLSETTNLAPSIAGSELFDHIRHMSWVSVPSFGLSLVLFLLVALADQPEVGAQSQMQAFLVTLDQNFNIAWYNLIPIVLLLVMAARKVPAFLAIITGTLVACLFTLLFQLDVLLRFVNDPELGLVMSAVKGLWLVLYDGYMIESDNESVNSLLSRGGMTSMLKMAWLVTCSMMMTGVLERIGFIRMLMTAMLWFIRSTGSLIATTMGTCLGVNLITGDQYMSIVLPGQMWKSEYPRRGLAAINLSRSLEDAGTLTSPLIPWNACGVFMAASLGVPTLSYFVFCFFNLLNPVIALIYAFANIKIARLDEVSAAEETDPQPLASAT